MGLGTQAVNSVGTSYHVASVSVQANIPRTPAQRPVDPTWLVGMGLSRVPQIWRRKLMKRGM